MNAARNYISVSEFKARCLALLDEVSSSHQMLIITKFGKPIAKVSPIEKTKPALLGSWKGVMEVEGDIVNFDTSDEWEALND
jgi:prevent-host-death family protein